MIRHPFWRSVFRAVRVTVVLVVCSVPLVAQHAYSVDSTLDLVGGVAENPQRLASDKRVGSYAIYPSISFNSRSPRSTTVANYAFGWDRLADSPPRDSTSHSATVSFSRDLSPTTGLRLSNSFNLTSDSQTFLALRGILPTEDESAFLLVFDPVVTHQKFLTDSLSAGVTRRLSEKSTLSFGAGFYLRDFLSANSSTFSDQRGASAEFSYGRRITERSEWNVGYTFSYYSFDTFSSAVSHVGRFGFSSLVAKDTTFAWTLGVSHVQNTGTSEFTASYEGSASLSKTIVGNNFSLRVSQDSGHPNGLASISKNRMISVGVDRKLSSVVSVFVSGSAFDSKGLLDNSFDSRGTSAAGNIGFGLTRNLSLQIGAHYYRYAEPAPLAFTQKRLFASVRYSHPNLLHSR
jgi:hypothetical protein